MWPFLPRLRWLFRQQKCELRTDLVPVLARPSASRWISAKRSGADARACRNRSGRQSLPLCRPRVWPATRSLTAGRASLGCPGRLCDDEARMSGPPNGTLIGRAKKRERLLRATAGRAGGELHPVTCNFRDPAQEADFRDQNFRTNLTHVRIAHVLGIALWIVWGLLVRGDLGPDRAFDLKMRYGVFIPIILVSLAFSYTNAYRRVWQWASAAVILATGFAWISYVSAIDAMPIDYGYVGVILIMTFSYTLIRLRFVLAAAVSAVLIVGYLAIGLGTNEVTSREVKLSSFYLLSFWFLGMIAAYVIERSTRLLFLRERQLDRERARSDALLLNVLPKAIV